MAAFISLRSASLVALLYSSVGEVSEWLKVPLSKSGVVNSHRGFESHPLRQKTGDGLTTIYRAETHPHETTCGGARESVSSVAEGLRKPTAMVDWRDWQQNS